MYGTIARLKVRPGMEERLRAMSEEETGLDVPGFLGEFTYRMDRDSNEYYMVVLFRDKETYFANANSPDQDARYREMLKLLESEPEWHDGEIVDYFISDSMKMDQMKRAA